MSAEILDASSRRVEDLLARFDAFPASTGARADAEELVRAVSGAYGAALERIVRTLYENAGARAEDVLVRCCDDPLVATLFIAHGLHPVPIEARVRAAIESVRPYVAANGGALELLSVNEDEVVVRLDGMADLLAKIERAVFEAAPEVLRVRAVGQTISLLELR